VEKYTADLTPPEQFILDDFFESLQWWDNTEAGPNVDLLTIGSFMKMIDFSNRWIYKGSDTKPPCAGLVYYNVLSTVYPISKKHLELFQRQLKRGDGGMLAMTGNWREIQDIDMHHVVYLQQTPEPEVVEEESVSYYPVVIGLSVTLFVVCLIALLLTFKVISLIADNKEIREESEERFISRQEST
jgi:hypothetical protein